MPPTIFARMRSEPIRVLFVCLGNICRSPLAEGVFRSLVSARGLDAHYHVDSAGTGGWHVGEDPDARSIAVALKNGVRLTSLQSPTEKGACATVSRSLGICSPR